MDKPDISPGLYLAILQAEIARLERIERNRKHKDGFRFPPQAYETVSDLGAICGARALLETLWHKDDEWRKAMMHLSKLEWDLRKKARENL